MVLSKKNQNCVYFKHSGKKKKNTNMKGIHHKGMKYSHIYMYSGQVKLGALCVNGILWLVAKKKKTKKNPKQP